MKLESFGISNFKAFGKSLQQLPMKPLTLIFGANSAGKSSLIHGLLWTAEAMEQNSFDVRVSKRVSGTLDLGGFLSVLRAHNPENKIRISIGVGSLPSGESIQLEFEIGIRTERDSGEIYRREWLEAHPDWKEVQEFNEMEKVMEHAVNVFGEIWCYIDGSTEELEAALSTEAAWEEENERHRLREKELDTSHVPLPSFSEARALFAEAQQAWNSRRELAPKVIPIFTDCYRQFMEIDARENRSCSVLSSDVRIGGKPVLQATRKLGTDCLTVEPETFDSLIWNKILGEGPSAGDRVFSTSGGSKSRSNCFENITFLHPSTQDLPNSDQWMSINRAIQWLVDQFDRLSKQLDLVVVGPLRALPSRRELLGYPREITTDPLLRPWLRLRDDETVLEAVNSSLKSLTKSHLSFWRASYGKIERVVCIDGEFPEKNVRCIGGGGHRPTNWEERGFMEGYVDIPEETLWPESGPFYGELKDDDPKAAVRMIEEHLAKQFPHEILFDLLLRDGRTGVDIKPQDVGVGISQIGLLVKSGGYPSSN